MRNNPTKMNRSIDFLTFFLILFPTNYPVVNYLLPPTFEPTYSDHGTFSSKWTVFSQLAITAVIIRVVRVWAGPFSIPPTTLRFSAMVAEWVIVCRAATRHEVAVIIWVTMDMRSISTNLIIIVALIDITYFPKWTFCPLVAFAIVPTIHARASPITIGAAFSISIFAVGLIFRTTAGLKVAFVIWVSLNNGAIGALLLVFCTRTVWVFAVVVWIWIDN